MATYYKCPFGQELVHNCGQRGAEMLIAMYVILTIFVPVIRNEAFQIAYDFMPIVIALVGIMILMSTIGLPISAGLGATVLGGIFSACGFVFHRLFDGLGMLVMAIPRLYRGLIRIAMSFGLNPAVGRVVAFLLTALIII